DLEHLPVDRRLDSMSLGDVLGPMHPDVAALLETAARRAGGELDELSGHYGAMASLGAWATRRPNVVGGTGRLVDALGAALRDRARTGERVCSVVSNSEGVRLEVQGAGGVHHVHAAACVMAVPAPVAATVVRNLPREKLSALESV